MSVISENQINATPNQQPSAITPLPPTPRRRWLWWIIGLVVILFAIAGLWWYTNNRSKNISPSTLTGSVQTPTSATTTTPTTSTSKTPAATSTIPTDWVNFTTDIFSYKAPKTLRYMCQTSSCLAATADLGKGLIVMFGGITSKGNLHDEVAKLTASGQTTAIGNHPIDVTKIKTSYSTVNDVEIARLVTSDTIPGIDQYSTYLQDAPRVMDEVVTTGTYQGTTEMYQMALVVPEKDYAETKPIFDQIVSTIKSGHLAGVTSTVPAEFTPTMFIDLKLSLLKPKDWTTYYNETAGFTFHLEPPKSKSEEHPNGIVVKRYDKKTLDDYLKNQSTIETFPDITLDNATGKTYYYKTTTEASEIPLNHYIVYIQDDEDLISIDFIGPSKPADLTDTENTILKSFRLLFK